MQLTETHEGSDVTFDDFDLSQNKAIAPEKMIEYFDTLIESGARINIFCFLLA